MNRIIMIILITGIITIFAGGGMYLLYMKTRPKKVTWKAKVYHRGKGVRKIIDKDGKVLLEDVEINDLKPFCEDILERIEINGRTIYKLIKLDKAVSNFDADCVDFWGSDKREVCILIDGESCTMLKKGYENKSGQVIFNPLPFDKVNMIKSEMALRKNRLKKEKDILQAVTPWVVAGICMLSLVSIAYIMTDSFMEMHDNEMKSNEKLSDSMVEAATIYREALISVGGVQKINKVQTPSNSKELEEFQKKLGRQPPSIE